MMPDDASRLEHYLWCLEQDGTHLVERCEEYVRRLRASQIPNLERAAVLAALSKFTNKFHLQTTRLDRLKAIEALADKVQELIQSGELADRTLPDDALLNYRDPSGQKCNNCNLPEAKHRVAERSLCAKCLIKVVQDDL